MMICAYCTRPANAKRVIRDEWQRVREIWTCDDHDTTTLRRANGGGEAQKEYMERRGYK